MSASQNSSPLAFQGEISVHYLDGTVVEGKYISQDMYNVFLMVDNERLMIPRIQIRFIKGKQNQQIEADHSQEAISAGVTTEQVSMPPPFETSQPSSTTDDDTAEGTMIKPPPAELPQKEEETEEEDATFVLPGLDLSEEEEEEEEEDSTVLLPPSMAVEEDEDEDEDGTVVLGPSDLEGASPEEDEEDATVVITQEELEVPVPTVELTCTSGPHTGEVFTFEADKITLGRSSDNMVVLSGDKEISRHHALIYREGDNFVIKDQDSLNGTFVNNEPVSKPRQLNDGDVILVGISSLEYQEL